MLSTLSVVAALITSPATPRQQAFAWIEKAGYKPLFSKPLVKVVSSDKDSPEEAEGFLVRSDGQETEAVDLGLTHYVFAAKSHPEIVPITDDTSHRSG